MTLVGAGKALVAAAFAAGLVALACSSRHRLGRLAGDDALGAGGSSDGGKSGSENGGSSATHGHEGQAGDGVAGASAPSHADPDVFVVH